MEHMTINAYGNEYAKSPYGFDNLFQHEFAHEWFANQMTAANWDDFWLHEGFAAYMQPLYGNWLDGRSEEHTSELQSLMRISYAVFCLKQKKTTTSLNPKTKNKQTEQ